MTKLVHDPERDCVITLGIPVDRLSLSETVEQAVKMANCGDGKSRLISTLNVDFLVNALATRLTRARHPELLRVLRDSDLVTADGFPIIWLSRIMGRPLAERVCGSDLLPALAKRASEEGLSLFLMGGAGDVARRAGNVLVERCPGLKIAGTAAPFVHTQGPGLENYEADDAALIDVINSSGADILFVGLGNPKQELWFNRNRDQLRVPVAIGVGGTFEFVTGGVNRAPKWMQKTNLEWVFRITQDPARLWKRYANGLGKLALLTLPLIATRLKQSLRSRFPSSDTGGLASWRTVWCSRDQFLRVIRLPRFVSRQRMYALAAEVARSQGRQDMRLIDFTQVKHIELSGVGAFFALTELQRGSAGNLQLMGLSESLRQDLAAARVLDVVEAVKGNALKALVDEGDTAPFACRSYVLNDTSLTFLSGTVNARRLKGIGFSECIERTSRDRVCVIDLRNSPLVETSGLVELARLLRAGGAKASNVVLSGATDHLMQMFRMADLGIQPRFINDQEMLSLLGGDS